MNIRNHHTKFLPPQWCTDQNQPPYSPKVMEMHSNSSSETFDFNVEDEALFNREEIYNPEQNFSRTARYSLQENNSNIGDYDDDGNGSGNDDAAGDDGGGKSALHTLHVSWKSALHNLHSQGMSEDESTNFKSPTSTPELSISNMAESELTNKSKNAGSDDSIDDSPKGSVQSVPYTRESATDALRKFTMMTTSNKDTSDSANDPDSLTQEDDKDKSLEAVASKYTNSAFSSRSNSERSNPAPDAKPTKSVPSELAHLAKHTSTHQNDFKTSSNPKQNASTSTRLSHASSDQSSKRLNQKRSNYSNQQDKSTQPSDLENDLEEQEVCKKREVNDKFKDAVMYLSQKCTTDYIFSEVENLKQLEMCIDECGRQKVLPAHQTTEDCLSKKETHTSVRHRHSSPGSDVMQPRRSTDTDRMTQSDSYRRQSDYCNDGGMETCIKPVCNEGSYITVRSDNKCGDAPAVSQICTSDFIIDKAGNVRRMEICIDAEPSNTNQCGPGYIDNNICPRPMNQTSALQTNQTCPRQPSQTSAPQPSQTCAPQPSQTCAPKTSQTCPPKPSQRCPPQSSQTCARQRRPQPSCNATCRKQTDSMSREQTETCTDDVFDMDKFVRWSKDIFSLCSLPRDENAPSQRSCTTSRNEDRCEDALNECTPICSPECTLPENENVSIQRPCTTGRNQCRRGDASNDFTQICSSNVHTDEAGNTRRMEICIDAPQVNATPSCPRKCNRCPASQTPNDFQLECQTESNKPMSNHAPSARPTTNSIFNNVDDGNHLFSLRDLVAIVIALLLFLIIVIILE